MRRTVNTVYRINRPRRAFDSPRYFHVVTGKCLRNQKRARQMASPGADGRTGRGCAAQGPRGLVSSLPGNYDRSPRPCVHATRNGRACGPCDARHTPPTWSAATTGVIASSSGPASLTKPGWRAGDRTCQTMAPDANTIRYPAMRPRLRKTARAHIIQNMYLGMY